MFSELLHRLLFPTLVTTIIGSLWTVGWCQAVIAEADRHSWPALEVPGHESQACDLSETADDGFRPDNGRSLHQVLLKNDQIIRVR